jgi:sensor histidine kinase YesM
MVSLMNDIRFLKNYIDLMRIRYSDHVEITLDSPHELPEDVAIPPLLLIVFVENAFKHGVSYNQKSFIHISIFYADGHLTTLISNSRPTHEEPPQSTGIGMENVCKRLDLTYGTNGYTLETHEERNTYTIKLVIPTLHA